MITPERLDELYQEWNDCDTWDDEEYRDWYEGLTAEEQAQIDAWDDKYTMGVQRICNEILARSESPENTGDQ